MRLFFIFKKAGKKIYFRLKRIGLARKLILYHTCVLIILVTFFGIYYYNSEKKSVESDIIKLIRQSSESIKMQIKRNIEICDKTVQSIISNEKFIHLISQKEEPDTLTVFEFFRNDIRHIQNITNINPDIHQLRIFLDNPHFPQMWRTVYKEEEMIEKDYIRSRFTHRNTSYWSFNHPGSIQSDEKSLDKVSLYKQIRYSVNRHIGIIEISMLSDIFWGDLYSQNQSGELMVCFLDSENNLIINNQSIFLKKYGLNISELSKTLVESNEIEPYYFSLDKNEMILMKDEIEELGCSMFFIYSTEPLIQKLSSIGKIVIIVCALVILLMSAVTYFITSTLLKKIKVIIAAMRKVQKGNLDVQIPIAKDDEIGELSYHFGSMLEKINELIFNLVRKEKTTKDAEVRALLSQINAHFIYNVLENIRMMAEINYQDEISDALTSLGNLMRYSMSWKRRNVPLKEEIEIVKDYISLVNIRYDNQIQFRLDMEKEIMQCEILKMSLQPIIENAVIHGLESKKEKGNLLVSGRRTDKKIHIEVVDNGTGMSKDTLEQIRGKINTIPDNKEGKRSGIGLANVNERIKLYYGNEYGLEIMSAKGYYTKVRMTIPYQ